MGIPESDGRYPLAPNEEESAYRTTSGRISQAQGSGRRFEEHLDSLE
jgi:hypothetical protein